MQQGKTLSKKKYRYTAFISYSSEDHELGQDWHIWLKNKIEEFPLSGAQRNKINPEHPLKEKLLPCYVDKFEMNANSNLQQSLKDALNDSLFLILLCNPKSFDSKYVRDELQHFKRTSNPQNIIYICTSGKGSEEESKNSYFLPDMVKDEPVVIDFRLKIDNNTYYSDTDLKRLKTVLKTKVNLHSKEINRRCTEHALETEKNLNRIVATILGLHFSDFDNRTSVHLYQILKHPILVMTILAVILIGSSVFLRMFEIDSVDNHQKEWPMLSDSNTAHDLIEQLDSAIHPKFNEKLANTLIEEIRLIINIPSIDERGGNIHAIFLYLQAKTNVALNQNQLAVRLFKEAIDRIAKDSEGALLTQEQTLFLAQCYFGIADATFAKGMHDESSSFVEISKEFIDKYTTVESLEVATELKSNIFFLMAKIALFKKQTQQANFAIEESQKHFDDLLRQVSPDKLSQYQFLEVENLHTLFKIDTKIDSNANRLIAKAILFLSNNPNNLEVSRILIDTLYLHHTQSATISETEGHINFLIEIRELFSLMIVDAGLSEEQLSIYLDAEFNTLKFLTSNVSDSDFILEQIASCKALLNQIKDSGYPANLYTHYLTSLHLIEEKTPFIEVKRTSTPLTM